MSHRTTSGIEAKPNRLIVAGINLAISQTTLKTKILASHVVASGTMAKPHRLICARMDLATSQAYKSHCPPAQLTGSFLG